VESGKWKVSEKSEASRHAAVEFLGQTAVLVAAFTVRRIPEVAPRDLLERTRQFSLDIARFCRMLPATKEAQEAASQLRRAANAVRSNYRAARKGRSRAEFEAKLGIVWEKADECVDWLEYLKKVEKVQSGKVESK
jgi:four helix bundle protein